MCDSQFGNPIEKVLVKIICFFQTQTHVLVKYVKMMEYVGMMGTHLPASVSMVTAGLHARVSIYRVSSQ